VIGPAQRGFDPLFFKKDALFWPIAEAARKFADFTSWPPVEAYGARLEHRAGVSFREQPPKPRRRRRAPVTANDLYDGRIVDQGWVPTRPACWHDFLNMLVWAAFPEAKWQLHARQHRAHAARIQGAVSALPNARTREQDALALVDEGGVVVVCTSERVEAMRGALAARDAETARSLFASGAARPVIFGHALYESLACGRPEVWGAAFIAPHDGALDSDAAALVSAASTSLAAALAQSEKLTSPADLARLELALIR
jgi:Protein of unknown function (DUF3025)